MCVCRYVYIYVVKLAKICLNRLKFWSIHQVLGVLCTSYCFLYMKLVAFRMKYANVVTLTKSEHFRFITKDIQFANKIDVQFSIFHTSCIRHIYEWLINHVFENHPIFLQYLHTKCYIYCFIQHKWLINIWEWCNCQYFLVIYERCGTFRIIKCF